MRRSDQVGTFLAAFLAPQLRRDVDGEIRHQPALRCLLGSAALLAGLLTGDRAAPAFCAGSPGARVCGCILVLSAVGVNQYVRFFVVGGSLRSDYRRARLVFRNGESEALDALTIARVDFLLEEDELLAMRIEFARRGDGVPRCDLVARLECGAREQVIQLGVVRRGLERAAEK